MAYHRNNIPVSISAGAFLLGALLLLILPLKWLLAALSAAMIHELCHLAAVKLTGGYVHEICIGRGGASIKIGPMDSLKELICALAGPLGGFTLLLFARWIPRVAICAGIHSIYNLLPIHPLDGGRALCHLLTVAVEKITGKKLNPKYEGFLHGAGMILLLGLMAVIMFKDIFVLIRG